MSTLPSDTPSLVLNKLAYVVSNPAGEWHALAVHSWSLTCHLPSLEEKLKENPKLDYKFIHYKKEIPNENRITYKPHLKFKQEHTILTPHKSLSYLLVNLNKNLKIKIDHLDLNNEGQLIVDDSMVILYFDGEVPEELKYLQTIFRPQIFDQLDQKDTLCELMDLVSDKSIYTNEFLRMLRDESPFNRPFNEDNVFFVILLKWTYDPETQNLIIGDFEYLLPVEGKRINYPAEID